jgi:hypothetical protein
MRVRIAQYYPDPTPGYPRRLVGLLKFWRLHPLFSEKNRNFHSTQRMLVLALQFFPNFSTTDLAVALLHRRTDPLGEHNTKNGGSLRISIFKCAPGWCLSPLQNADDHAPRVAYATTVPGQVQWLACDSLGPERGDYSNRCATARNQRLRKSRPAVRQRGLPIILHWPDPQRAAGAAAP